MLIGDDMYNIKSTNSTSDGFLACGFIFLFIGIIMSTIFFFVFYSANVFYDSYVDASNYSWKRVSEDDYKVTVEYRYAGEEYSCTPNVTSSNKFAVEKVYFNENNPANCYIDLKESVGKWIYLILAIPATFVVSSLLMIIKGFERKKRFKLLANNGILVKRIPCTVQNMPAQVNGKYYARIEATYIFPDGTSKKLKQTVLVDKKKKNEIITSCDLLYLLEDYNVYYLGFDIEYQSHVM